MSIMELGGYDKIKALVDRCVLAGHCQRSRPLTDAEQEDIKAKIRKEQKEQSKRRPMR